MTDAMIPFTLVEGVWKEDQGVSYFTSDDITTLDEVEGDAVPQQAVVEYNGTHRDVTLLVTPGGGYGYVLAKEIAP